ncbi:MAG TPA: acyl-CoA synthetase [Methylomirabilota bacterium]|nr:acyl-CoA synthetase [Methylomirabilota bacterium]
MGAGLLEINDYATARRAFHWKALWELVDGTAERLNLAHECVDRHPRDAVALRIQKADGGREVHTFGALAAWSSRFAHWLEGQGVARGERVAIMLEPSLPFYGALFGAVRRGAIAVPLFTLFGPEGLALRVRDCSPTILLAEREAARWQSEFPGVRVVTPDAAFEAALAAQPAEYAPATAADDLAVFQYTSGTTRALPEAVKHTHRSVVTLMIAALYGIGLRPGDRYFCPSSPAWGHGLWHGTIAPLALGIAVGSYAGRFDATLIFEALRAFEITNMAAAPTVYRLLRASGLAARHPFRPAKLSFTGEPMDAGTWQFIEETFGVTPRSMYGSTEVGVIIVSYPGFTGYDVRPGALGTAAPGWEVGVVDAAGRPLPPGTMGEIAVRRRGRWFLVKDRGRMDADGYFFHAGRSDDVIISAGWTMSAIEIEAVLMSHPDVREAAVIGTADELRGQIAKAFVVARRRDAGLVPELQRWVRERLSQHEYPRAIEVVDELPKTPAGKINRQALRERPAGRPAAPSP